MCPSENIGRKLDMKSKSYAAEAIGTFWLTFGGCGSAVIAAAFPQVGIGLVGVSLAFGLTVVTMAYAIGHVSGCHLNPAVTIGLTAGGRFPAGQVLPYIIAQVVGAIMAAALLPGIAETPRRRVVAKNIRDLQCWTGHRRGLLRRPFLGFLRGCASRSSGLSTVWIMPVATRV
jgi:glycerol uptake facilitator-like aquaporin